MKVKPVPNTEQIHHLLIFRIKGFGMNSPGEIGLNEKRGLSFDKPLFVFHSRETIYSNY